MCGLYRLGLNLTPITHHSVILKAKQEESKKKDWERNDGRKGRWEREGENLDLGIFCCSQSVTKGKILL